MTSQGARFTLSDDAHSPTDVGENYDLLKGYLARFGVTKVYAPRVGGGVEVLEGVLDHPFWSGL